jgi:hypothetical protein
MRFVKNNSEFIFIFTSAIVLFLSPLISMRYSFLYGDNYVQFYPWFCHYSKALKNFSFPYWLRYSQSGFPLMAEGQIGGYYPLNILMFFLLPFDIAYNYSIVLHFIMGGVFTYLYARKLGSDQKGGTLAALLFCFGSSYAGCFYNIITLRVLSWFPLCLLLIELYFARNTLRYMIFAGIVAGLQFLSGFAQVAFYCMIFYAAYFLYKTVSLKRSMGKCVLAFGVFLLLTFILYFPQFRLTYELFSHSGRLKTDSGFALWGSFPPVGVFGLIFPHTTHFMRANLYLGIVSLYFILFSLLQFRKYSSVRILVLILALSLFCAFGSYNPFYVLFLKLGSFYAFRNPGKFLFFAEFSLSVLAGLGLTFFLRNKEERVLKKCLDIFMCVLLAALVLFSVSRLILYFFKKEIFELAGWYVSKYIIDKPYHRYDLAYYQMKVGSIYGNLLRSFSFSNSFTKTAFLQIIVAVFVFPVLLKRRKAWLITAIILIDLFIFSFHGIGFRKNIKSFSVLKPENPKILGILRSDVELFRILPFDIKSGRLPNWSLPNANILYGIDSVAGYSPLAGSDYRKKLLDFEVVDDSLGLRNAKKEAISKGEDILRLLNVKYVLSPVTLNFSFLEQLFEENGLFLYRFKYYLPRVFFAEAIRGDIASSPEGCLNSIEYKEGLVEVSVTAKARGFIVLSENYYPGWEVYVDGKKAELLKAWGLVQAVEVDRGKHSVGFSYKPYHF